MFSKFCAGVETTVAVTEAEAEAAETTTTNAFKCQLTLAKADQQNINAMLLPRKATNQLSMAGSLKVGRSIKKRPNYIKWQATSNEQTSCRKTSVFQNSSTLCVCFSREGKRRGKFFVCLISYNIDREAGLSSKSRFALYFNLSKLEASYKACFRYAQVSTTNSRCVQFTSRAPTLHTF